MKKYGEGVCKTSEQALAKLVNDDKNDPQAIVKMAVEEMNLNKMAR